MQKLGDILGLAIPFPGPCLLSASSTSSRVQVRPAEIHFCNRPAPPPPTWRENLTAADGQHSLNHHGTCLYILEPELPFLQAKQVTQFESLCRYPKTRVEKLTLPPPPPLMSFKRHPCSAPLNLGSPVCTRERSQSKNFFASDNHGKQQYGIQGLGFQG